MRTLSERRWSEALEGDGAWWMVMGMVETELESVVVVMRVEEGRLGGDDGVAGNFEYLKFFKFSP